MIFHHFKFEDLHVCLASNMIQTMNPMNAYFISPGSKLCSQVVYLAQTVCNTCNLLLYYDTQMIFSTAK